MTPREKVNILLVDDQPGKLLSLETVLAELDENLMKAGSADEALKHILSTDIAVLLVDVCMPKMDGFQLAELVREHPRFRRTAIIFISAVHLSDADRLRGYDLGAVDYIPVPIIPQVLRAKVAVFAELYRKTRELQRVNAELEAHVAELDRSNERLLFADRMATIGTLAAGLGHDMGNLLLPVRMHLDALEAGELPAASREDLKAIRTATEYLRRLAGSLRLLALDPRNMNMSTAATDLREWWFETEGMIRNGVSRLVSLTAEIPTDLAPVKIDKAGLTQIVFNLVQNAGDALKGREDGRVVVSARREATRGTVMLEVRDNGTGMDEDARRRCLEPFFTTKTRGLGTGLGLALVKGLVRQAGGTISVESAVGSGSVFRLEIPQAGETIAREQHPRQEVRPVRPGERRGVAVVTLADRRLTAHVRSVLSSLEYDVRPGEPAEADLWVTEDKGNGSLDAVRAFVAGRPLSRAVVFGDEGAAQRAAPTEADGANGVGVVICIERGIKPSMLHLRIGEALGLSRNGK